MAQVSLFGAGAPACDASFAHVERVDLGAGAWIETARSWLAGHERVCADLVADVAWRAEERPMYDRVVDVPRRLGAIGPAELARWPILETMRVALSRRYDVTFDRVGVALYRNGDDSVAWHGDTVARRMKEAIVATVSVGAPRRFLVRPTGGGASRAWSLGWGDLVVMGGTCQRTHQHSVPKVARAEPRVAIMFRPTWTE